MIALSLFRKNESSSSCTRISVIDELHVTTESDDRIWRDIIRRDIRALDLLAKKTSNLRIHSLQRVAQKCRQRFTVHRCQNDRRPLLGMTSLNVAHGHIFLPTFYPQCAKPQRANNCWFRAFGRDVSAPRFRRASAKDLRHNWTLLTFDTRAIHIRQLMRQTNEFHCPFNAI